MSRLLDCRKGSRTSEGCDRVRVLLSVACRTNEQCERQKCLLSIIVDLYSGVVSVQWCGDCIVTVRSRESDTRVTLMLAGASSFAESRWAGRIVLQNRSLQK